VKALSPGEAGCLSMVNLVPAISVNEYCALTSGDRGRAFTQIQGNLYGHMCPEPGWPLSVSYSSQLR